VRVWFNVRKAAQIVAFFAKQEGDSINVLKLVKLVYLANRLALEKHNYPLVNDILVSMDQGPVNSLTFDYINGMEEERAGWDEFLTARANHTVGLSDPALTIEQLDELSDDDLEILKETWGRFGRYNKWALRDYTHEHCPEWEDPQGTSAQIPYERVFKFLSKKDPRELQKKIFAQRAIDMAFSGKR
jgi:uncharacterized phage-associated protein